MYIYVENLLVFYRWRTLLAIPAGDVGTSPMGPVYVRHRGSR